MVLNQLQTHKRFLDFGKNSKNKLNAAFGFKMLRFALLILCLVLCFSIVRCVPGNTISKLVEFTASNITLNLDVWDSDLAIMFYAPYCKYCKQLSPSWDQIATLTMGTRSSLMVGKFNCESPDENIEVCRYLNIDRYPSISFIGYGDMNQRELFETSATPRVVRFNADLYPEAIYEWVRMLSKISEWQQRFDTFRNAFTGNSRVLKQAKSREVETLQEMQVLQTEVEVLRKKSDIFSEELEMYKARELFASIDDFGDPFPLLYELEPSKKNLPLRVCVAELAKEYCKYMEEDEEPFCDLVKLCHTEWMAGLECRPPICPFLAKAGCNIVSSCMKPDVLLDYQLAVRSWGSKENKGR